jgi:hypothetical protein
VKPEEFDDETPCSIQNKKTEKDQSLALESDLLLYEEQ